MIEATHMLLQELLGLEREASELEARHLVWRATVVFVFAVVLARFADRRMLGHNSGFDIVVLIIVGSVLTRAIVGQSDFFPTLGAAALLVGLHRMIGTMAFLSHGFSKLLKGRAHVLVRDGVPVREAMKRGKITDDDLDENLRLNGGVDRIEEVTEARIERNGSISVVKRHADERRDSAEA